MVKSYIEPQTWQANYERICPIEANLEQTFAAEKCQGLDLFDTEKETFPVSQTLVWMLSFATEDIFYSFVSEDNQDIT